METEEQLIAAVKQSDRQAMRRLYDRYAGMATAVGLRYVPDRDEVRDVLQDSFIKVFTSIASFHYRGEGSLKSWVLTIVAHRALDYLMEKGRFAAIGEWADVADETPDDDVGDVPPEVLTQLIGRLPTGYRAVLNLFAFEQMSHREIAQRLGIKESTSASQFLRAKKLLKKLIKEYQQTGKI